jgi:subtilisin-like proprotein convertase family protein
MKGLRNFLPAAAVAAGLILAAVAPSTAAPLSISYSGELRAENGVLYTGAVAVTASIFGQTSGGSPLWGPQNIGQVMVSQGLFTTAIGGAGAPSLDPVLMANDNLWLELSINGAPMSPRQRLHAVPFARVAASAQSVGNIPANQVATLSALAAHPSTAAPSAAAPQNPVAGQLWLDTVSNKVFVWNDGAWEAVSAAGLTPDEMPGDGLNEVSNQTLSNEFLDVQAAWTGGPVNVPDNNPAGVSATINVQEGASAKLYGVKIDVKLELNVVSQVQMVLQPPPSTGVNPIVLFDGVLAPTPGQVPLVVSMSFDPANKPELAELLNTLPAGNWTLNVSDDQLTVVTPPLNIGKLTQFGITYDVLRSDQVAVQGDMFVLGDLGVAGTIQGTLAASGNATIAGSLITGGNATVQGNLVVSGPVQGKVIMFSGGCSAHGTASGVNKYCLDQTEINTAAGYFTVATNGDITVQRAGFYEVSWWAIVGGGGVASADATINVNGSARALQRCNVTSNGGWFNQQLRKVLLLSPGDVVNVTADKASLSHAWHQWGGSGGWGGFQMRYVGSN